MDGFDSFGRRPACDDDFAPAQESYIATMRPLMEQLGCWNEAERRAAFQKSFKPEEVTFITNDGYDIGWIQVTERENDLNLAQIQVYEPYRGKGIATSLIKELKQHAASKGKALSLSAVRSNRAIGLYKRLGFRIVDPDASPIVDMILDKQPARKKVSG